MLNEGEVTSLACAPSHLFPEPRHHCRPGTFRALPTGAIKAPAPPPATNQSRQYDTWSRNVLSPLHRGASRAIEPELGPRFPLLSFRQKPDTLDANKPLNNDLLNQE
jgi:hypothetical protein